MHPTLAEFVYAHATGALSAVVINVTHYRDGWARRWVVRSTRPLTNEEVEQLQTEHGYHPMGYGGPGTIARTMYAGDYRTSWSCADSCD